MSESNPRCSRWCVVAVVGAFVVGLVGGLLPGWLGMWGMGKPGTGQRGETVTAEVTDRLSVYWSNLKSSRAAICSIKFDGQDLIYVSTDTAGPLDTVHVQHDELKRTWSVERLPSGAWRSSTSAPFGHHARPADPEIYLADHDNDGLPDERIIPDPAKPNAYRSQRLKAPIEWEDVPAKP